VPQKQKATADLRNRDDVAHASQIQWQLGRLSIIARDDTCYPQIVDDNRG
jgi:hypothetical protein